MNRRSALALSALVGLSACDDDCGSSRTYPISQTPATGSPASAPADGEVLQEDSNATRLVSCGTAICWSDATTARSQNVFTVAKTGGARRTLWSGAAASSLVGVRDGLWVATYVPAGGGGELRYIPLGSQDAGPVALATTSTFPDLAVDGDTLWMLDRGELLRAAPGERPRVVTTASPRGDGIAAAAGKVLWLVTPYPEAGAGADLDAYDAVDKAPVSSLVQLVSGDAGSGGAVVATGLVRHDVQIATDGVYAYLLDGPDKRRRIARVPLAGGAIESLHEVGTAMTLRVIGDQLYWFEARSGGRWDTVVRMPKAGGAVEAFAHDPSATASFVVSDGSQVYWSSFSGIRRKGK